MFRIVIVSPSGKGPKIRHEQTHLDRGDLGLFR